MARTLGTTMKKIFTYKNSLTSSCSYSPGELHFSGFSKVKKNEEIEKKIKGDVHLIWKKLVLPIHALLQQCPYCSGRTKVIQSKPLSAPKGARKIVDVYSCECGWWGLGVSWNTSGINFYDSYKSNTIVGSILKTYELDSDKVPIQTLNQHIKNNKFDLYSIHPKKMEELVQFVFKSFYNCEVIHCGQTNDGGIDLIMINSDKPTLIQVKRRTKNSHIESVSTVRDLLGAMFINESKNGVIVSTANRFSRQSKNVINKLLERGKVNTFQLIDFTRFCEMLDLTGNPNEDKLWKQAIEVYQ